MIRVSVFAFALAAATMPQAATLSLSHPYGELVDRDATRAYFEASPPDRVDCTIAPVVQRAATGTAIEIVVRRVAPGAQAPICIAPNEVSLGVLSAGWWTVTLRVLDTDGSTLVEQQTAEWLVSPPDTLCGRDPVLRGGVIVEHATLTPAQLAQRVATDAAFAARLGHPAAVQGAGSHALLVYDWLDNPHDRRASLIATGEFRSAGANGFACFAAPPPDVYGDVIEFHNAALDHYFYTVDAAEIAGLDSGTGARGWTRTGKSFRVLVAPGCTIQRRDQVAYRFFGKPGVGPSSHVFTVDRRECRIVRDSGAWTYESSPFWASPVDSKGGCLAGGVPVYRIWKPFGESNHRFTTDAAVVAEMAARGWVNEGIAMCVAG